MIMMIMMIGGNVKVNVFDQVGWMKTWSIVGPSYLLDFPICAHIHYLSLETHKFDWHGPKEEYHLNHWKVETWESYIDLAQVGDS